LAGVRVNAVTPPHRSISCSRTRPNSSEGRGVPSFELSGKKISTKCTTLTPVVEIRRRDRPL
jgi:hypothetical protein